MLNVEHSKYINRKLVLRICSVLIIGALNLWDEHEWCSMLYRSGLCLYIICVIEYFFMRFFNMEALPHCIHPSYVMPGFCFFFFVNNATWRLWFELHSLKSNLTFLRGRGDLSHQVLLKTRISCFHYRELLDHRAWFCSRWFWGDYGWRWCPCCKLLIFPS
jgi:hypothetical protein